MRELRPRARRRASERAGAQSKEKGGKFSQKVVREGVEPKNSESRV